MYNLGDKTPEVSYDGLTFTYNGIDYDMSEFCPGSYILDVRHAYEKEIFEMPDRLDRAMCAFCDYADSGKASDYAKFMEYVPEDATFFAVTDPQTWFMEDQTVSDEVEPTGFNKVMIVALYNNSKLEISDSKGKSIEPVFLNKGQYNIFSMTVSESMPLYTVKVTVDDPDKKLSAEWPVVEFSGETYQHCKFY